MGFTVFVTDGIKKIVSITGMELRATEDLLAKIVLHVGGFGQETPNRQTNVVWECGEWEVVCGRQSVVSGVVVLVCTSTCYVGQV